MIWFWWISIRLCVSVFQGSLFVMIDGSEKRNGEGGFLNSEFRVRVFEKHSNPSFDSFGS